MGLKIDAVGFVGCHMGILHLNLSTLSRLDGWMRESALVLNMIVIDLRAHCCE